MSARTPMVIDRGGKSPRGWDVYSRLLEDRIVFLTGPIDTDVSISVTAQLLFLQYSNPNKEISMYISSPGGMVHAGLAIYDTMHYIKPDIKTIAIGGCASMGAILLAAGTKGKRYALPNTRMMIHQPSGAFQGQAEDIMIHAKETDKTRVKLQKILAHHTGQPESKIEAEYSRDFFMSSEEAVEYGLIDEIIQSIHE